MNAHAVSPAKPDLATVKSRRRAAWGIADDAMSGAKLRIVGDKLGNRVDLRGNPRVVDLASGSGGAALAVAAPTAATQGDVLRRCADALDLMLTHRGNPALVVERALADDPHSVFAHCLRAALIVRNGADTRRPLLAASLAAIVAACPASDDPARRHAAAAQAWLDGDDALAAERYGAIVIDWPRDILALTVSHALDFRLGRRRMLRDRIAQVLPEWDASVPGYASLLAMYAFGLEENGQYRRAEKQARRALAIDPTHVGAMHVVAHVMEMQGRAQDGLAFLAANEAAWSEGNGLAVHLAWHRALLHLDADDPAAALAVYDARIASLRAPDMSELADASALLWRLQLRDVALGQRWRHLADRWERASLAGARPFYIVHAIMAFAATGRTVAAAQAFTGLPHADTGSAPLPFSEDALLSPLCKALLAFGSDDYAECVDWLVGVRHIAHRCGGSIAQCDVIHLTFTEAALRAHRMHLARALVAERAAQKPASRLNRWLQRRLRESVANDRGPVADLAG
jgi:tetratricopeptide (TPR) repeat protein